MLTDYICVQKRWEKWTRHIEDNVDASTRRLEDYLKKSQERLNSDEIQLKHHKDQQNNNN